MLHRSDYILKHNPLVVPLHFCSATLRRRLCDGRGLPQAGVPVSATEVSSLLLWWEVPQPAAVQRAGAGLLRHNLRLTQLDVLRTHIQLGTSS